MLMAALIGGGMPAAWSEARNHVANSQADDSYHPNRDGLYEVPLREYSQCGFPLAYAGKLIKVMVWGLPSLAVNQYRIVLMRRDPEEIRQSYEAFFGRPLRHPWLAEYGQRMEQAESLLRNRRDVLWVDVLDYRAVVDEPASAFERLAANGWPIDVNKSAAVVDPAQCRFRREALTIGI
jgi:hypothetical protein